MYTQNVYDSEMVVINYSSNEIIKFVIDYLWNWYISVILKEILSAYALNGVMKLERHENSISVCIVTLNQTT